MALPIPREAPVIRAVRVITISTFLFEWSNSGSVGAPYGSPETPRSIYCLGTGDDLKPSYVCLISL